MGITYNKEKQTKDRRIMTTGPRDLQLRHARDMSASAGQPALIDELRSQIKILTDKLDGEVKNIGYTDEQVNEEIIKAVKMETLTLKTNHRVIRQGLENKIQILEDKILALMEVLDRRNKRIEELEQEKKDGAIDLATIFSDKFEELASSISEGAVIKKVKDGSPIMEDVYIDPIDKESSVETHIKIKEISGDKKEQMDEKTKKLRKILGKLPENKI